MRTVVKERKEKIQPGSLELEKLAWTLGVPQTDIEDVKQHAKFDQIMGFENEMGMIHSIAHYFEHFGIKKGAVGLEYNFLTPVHDGGDPSSCQA